MELSNALKSLFATLTTKTTADANDGVMLLDLVGTSPNNPAPNGKITIKSLAATINALGATSWHAVDNIANIREAGMYLSTPATLNRPADVYCAVMAYTYSPDPTNIYLLLAIETNGASAYQGVVRGTNVVWHKVSFDVPAFYNSYANLAALATGIMGQAISSITAAYFQGTIAQAVFDNVFIAVTRLNDSHILAVKPKDWSSYSSASAYHIDGVLLVSGDKNIVVATTEISLPWGADSDTHAPTTNTPIVSFDDAMATFDGKERTANAVLVSEYAATTTTTGYCNAYSTVTSDYSSSSTAYLRRKDGAWWLPSVGEMMMIWSNMAKINQVMTLIGGTPLSADWHWTSVERDQNWSWFINLDHGYLDSYVKRTVRKVRPVCAY